MIRIAPDLLLRAYAAGVFPMAEGRDDPRLFFIDPDKRGVVPLDRFRVPRKLRRQVRRRLYEVRRDTALEAVLDGCAEAAEGRPDTWINAEIRRLALELGALGHCHSVEAWRGGELVGGLYGVALGGAFFGESMFSRADNASKVALVHLAARLRAGGFTLLDCQFVTDHLRQFGAVEIPRAAYLSLLEDALRRPASFDGPPDDSAAVEALLQASSRTS